MRSDTRAIVIASTPTNVLNQLQERIAIDHILNSEECECDQCEGILT